MRVDIKGWILLFPIWIWCVGSITLQSWTLDRLHEPTNVTKRASRSYEFTCDFSEVGWRIEGFHVLSIYEGKMRYGYTGKQKFTHDFHFKLHSNTHHLYTTHRQKNLSEDLPLGSIRIRLDKASRSQQKRNHPKQIHNLEDSYCTQILSEPIASSSLTMKTHFVLLCFMCTCLSHW